jgi:hypothetical protein
LSISKTNANPSTPNNHETNGEENEMKNRATTDFVRTTLVAATAVTKLMATLVLMIVCATWVAHAQSLTTFYVATNGNDSWNGRSPTHTTGNNGPFASLAKAQMAVEGASGTSSVTVQVRGGTYYLPLSTTNPGPLTFGTADSGNATNGIIWENYATETPVVSGGVPVGKGGLGLTWTETILGGKILWQVPLPSTIQPFEYLFYTPASGSGTTGAQRRLRSRLESANGVGYYMNGTQCTAVNPLEPPTVVADSFCNLGTFLREAGTVAPTDKDGTGCPSVTNANPPNQSKCTDRFYYNPSDPITHWINLNGTYTGNPSGTGFQGPCEATAGSTYPEGDIGLTLFDAWTVDAMRVACLDPSQNVAFLIGPANSNSGVFDYVGVATGHRYLVENTKDAFSSAFNAGQTGIWFWDRSTNVLNYISNQGEQPNSDTVVIPQLGGQFPVNESDDYIGGSLISATGLSFVTFKNITFEVDDFIPSFTTGFNNDVNGEMSVPQAIDCESCQNVIFDTITVRHTSASAILIASPGTTGPPSQNDTIQNSTFYDIGDSGIRIGHTPVGGAKGDQPQYVVNHVTVQNNLIQGYSRVFADGEGIAEGNGNTITYSHNDINDGYHAGISICQLDCANAGTITGTGANGTNILSQYNHLWNLMQGVTSDGGSLYYNIGGQSESGSGNEIYNNLVHDTSDSGIIDVVNGVRLAPGSGYGGEGIYLDAQSGGVKVENNVVFHVSAYTTWMTSGPTVLNAANPNLFSNNIFSLGILGMFGQQDPWPFLNINKQQVPSCGSGYQIGTQVQFHDNIFNFDLNESLPPPSAPPGFHVVWGCTDSCTLNYNQFQDFEGNAYWRAGTPGTGPLFCSDTSAFYVITDPPTGSGSAGNNCPISPNNKNSGTFTFLTFDLPAGGVKTWQHGEPPDPPGTPVPMNEDPLGVCNYNPSFGTTGNPSDYLLSAQPPIPFNITQTNSTINTAGRTSGASLSTVPATFPTYSYTNTQF